MNETYNGKSIEAFGLYLRGEIKAGRMRKDGFYGSEPGVKDESKNYCLLGHAGVFFERRPCDIYDEILDSLLRRGVLDHSRMIEYNDNGNFRLAADALTCELKEVAGGDQ